MGYSSKISTEPKTNWALQKIHAMLYTIYETVEVTGESVGIFELNFHKRPFLYRTT